MAVRDVIFGVSIIGMLALSFFILNYVLNETTTAIVANPVVNSSNSSVTAFNSVITTANKLDYIVFAFFIGICLAILVSGWFVSGYPIFMFFYIFGVSIAVAVSAVFSNIWQSETAKVIYGTTLNYFPISNHLITYLPIYAAVIGFMGLMAMFAKPMVQGSQ